jgi:large subunit ribosomal protein L5
MSEKTELEKKYINEVIPALKGQFKYKNPMAVPTIQKIVVNAGIGTEYRTNSNVVTEMGDIIASIAGQRPVVTNAKVSVANFKVREGMPNGLKVTLRGDRMWDFLAKLIHLTLPRVKDFRGVSRKSFDGKGNYSLGIKDHTIFPEIDSSTISKIRSLQVVISTTANSNEEAELLLEKLDFPFEKPHK